MCLQHDGSGGIHMKIENLYSFFYGNMTEANYFPYQASVSDAEPPRNNQVNKALGANPAPHIA